MNDLERDDLVQALKAIWPAARESETIDHLIYKDGSQIRSGAKDTALFGDERSPIKDGFGQQLQISDHGELHVGGSGVVVQCEPMRVEHAGVNTLEQSEDDRVDTPPIVYALKGPRVSIFERDDLDPATEYSRARREERVQIKLAHPNVAKVFASFRTVVRSGSGSPLSIPFVLLEWIKGARQLRKHLQERDWSANELARILTESFDALAHIHENGLIHWDLKGDNLMVGSDGRVKLMDLGNSRNRRSEPYGVRESALTTRRNLPPGLQERYLKANDDLLDRDTTETTNRISVALESDENWDTPALDMYMLAREVNRLFGFDEATLELDHQVLTAETIHSYEELRREHRERMASADEETRYQYRFVDLIIKRLLASKGQQDLAFYETAAEVVETLQRLAPAFGDADDVPELHAVPQHVLRLPGISNVPWTERVSAVANSRPMKRLVLHRQLATVKDVYPGAEHTRWEHSLGTLLTTVLYIRALYADRTNVFFRADMTRLDVEAMLFAAIIHDIGHPAFGHQFEEWPLVDRTHEHDSYSKWLLELVAHSSVGAQSELDPEVVTQLESDAEIVRDLTARWSQQPGRLRQRTLEILAPEVSSSYRTRRDKSEVRNDADLGREQPLLDRAWSRSALTEVLHSIIDGDCDADKLDYLKRDGVHCGVEYPAGIDELRLLQSLTTVTSSKQEGFKPVVGVTMKGVLPLESFVIARYQMFRSVYWHGTVRSLTSALHFVLDHVIFERPAADQAKCMSRVWSAARTLADKDFLAFLGRELNEIEDSAEGRTAETRAVRARQALEGLSGERSKVYWRVLELYGAADPRSDREALADVQDLEPDDNALYWALVDVWWPRGLTGRRLALHRRKLRKRLTAEFQRAVRGRGPSLKLVDGDVLLDVPDPDKEQATNLYVQKDADSPTAIPFSHVTGIAKGVEEAFRRSLRQARVFVRPKIMEDLARLENSAIRECLRDAIRASTGEFRLKILGRPVEELQ